ncbi:MAG: RsmE family RNA methyltransferase [Acidobacteriota bacterium]|jgi:16S rRNA (uracil1498-N3)-methyltransferase
MTRRRFYVPRESIEDGIARLPQDQSHHLRDVLRIGAGEVVEVFDGEGDGYIGDVAIHGSCVLIQNLRQLPPQETRVGLILAVSLIKSAKFEWILQKATELGVHEVIPVETNRSNIRITRNKLPSRLERWNRIVQEASKQCGRFSAPRVRQPLDYGKMLQCEDFSGFTKILFYEKAAELWTPDTRTLSGGVVLCIGPEGGWNTRETEQAACSGWNVYSLGPLTLRAETAAIAAVSIIQYHINLGRVYAE